MEAVFPPGQTAQQADQETRQEMSDSQTAATAAALQELGIPVTVSVGSVVKGVPAARVLRRGDVLLAVQGRPVTGFASLREAVAQVAPGQTVQVRLRRVGEEQTVDVTTTKDAAGRTAVGLTPQLRLPVQREDPDRRHRRAERRNDVRARHRRQADARAPHRRQQIAGTGEIGPDGTVAPIGGIAEKMIGARRVGARWFLAPADNCSEVVGHIPDGLHVVRISTLHGARQAVEAIAQGGSAAAALPTCS